MGQVLFITKIFTLFHIYLTNTTFYIYLFIYLSTPTLRNDNPGYNLLMGPNCQQKNWFALGLSD